MEWVLRITLGRLVHRWAANRGAQKHLNAWMDEEIARRQADPAYRAAAEHEAARMEAELWEMRRQAQQRGR